MATVKDVIVLLGDDDHPPVTGLVARFGRLAYSRRGYVAFAPLNSGNPVPES